MAHDALIQELRQEVRRLEGSRPIEDRPPVISTGVLALDRLLPEHGLRTGSLTEWLSPNLGGGAGMLALMAAREACFEGGALVVIDRQDRFYPPAAAAMGIDLEKVILVRPTSSADELWALDQALRCEGVAAVWGLVEAIDWRTFRRLQLAAESQHALGLLVRSSKHRSEPSWSEIQLLVEPRPSMGNRRLRVELTRGRGHIGDAVELEVDEVTGFVSEALAYKAPESAAQPPIVREHHFSAFPASAIKPA
jgi:protein ImuA